jgi:hydroxymethylglutaryl-CoA reductase (NADPH)
VPWAKVKSFLDGIREIPEKTRSGEESNRIWITKSSSGQRSLTEWASNAWTEFVDLLKNAETLDITIMFLGYLSMHLTFVSLFVSMRKMGSNFWLATSTLFSSMFAFSFGLAITTKLGVPINMVLLSEGLPFLVVTVGFEKPIVLTKAVLSASLNNKRQETQQANSNDTDKKPRTVHYAVQAAVNERGFEIVRDYAIEIIILIAGAASGIQGGLRQFCFLAAWIMFFDCILLFTFYTAILCIKLEINRIRRHVALRRALEEDGVSRRVAENVANSTEWPRAQDSAEHTTRPGVAVFGKNVGESSVPRFKVLLFGGFILVNVINICTIPFRAGAKTAITPTVTGIQGVLNSPTIDPFKVADSGLDFLHTAAEKNSKPLLVTVFPPIKYDLKTPEIEEPETFFEGDYDHILDAMGGKVIEGVLKSLEDPVLSKWIIVALTVSLALNGYLFNAARWSIKDTRATHEPTFESEIKRIPSPEPQVPAAPSLETANGHAKEPIKNENLENGALSGSERTMQECEEMIKQGRAAELTDKEVLTLSVVGKIPGYALEKTLDNPKVMTKLQSLTRAVKIRRGLVSRTRETMETTSLLEHSKLPYKDYNYENVHGACCENVIGYLPLPCGVAGPMIIDGQSYFLPMATTEGVLVASTNRGCKAINAGGGAITVLTGDGMTRGPCVGFSTLARAGAAKNWIDSDEGQSVMKKAFNSTSRFARLQTMKAALAGTYLYIRFKTTTGDAMGMNMISKGVERALEVMKTEGGFEDMNVISVSGNYCTDKKAAAINWIDGRGKSVVAEAIIPADVVRKTLKSDVNALVELNVSKNLIGSAMAGSIGGFNAHAANIVAAMFLATGQDPAQVVESANCITVMKKSVSHLRPLQPS